MYIAVSTVFWTSFLLTVRAEVGTVRSRTTIQYNLLAIRANKFRHLPYARAAAYTSTSLHTRRPYGVLVNRGKRADDSNRGNGQNATIDQPLRTGSDP